MLRSFDAKLSLMPAIPSFYFRSGLTPLLRAVIPIAGLAAFGVFALLWHAGWDRSYFGILRTFGLDPFRFPFLDTHALLSAVECQRQGLNTYVENPCDALGRVHAYSPLWLLLIPGFLNTGSTTVVGAGLDVLFILSLGFVFRPLSWKTVTFYGIAVFSPVTLFALERANNDLIVFLLLIGAALLWSRSKRKRPFAYTLCVGAGLLKYYPMVLLLLLLRERPQRAVQITVAAALSVLMLLVGYRGEIGAALANIPHLSYFSDAFSAKNLPFGVAETFGESNGFHRAIGGLLLLLIVGIAVARARLTVLTLAPCQIDWTGWETRLLAIASLLLPACFFSAQNIAYRCIYLLLAIPGLLQLRSSDNPMLRRWTSLMIAAALFLLWEGALNHTIATVFQDSAAWNLLATLFWLERELVWWWSIAGFLGLAMSFVSNMPLTSEALQWLHRQLPGRMRRVMLYQPGQVAVRDHTATSVLPNR